MSPRELVETVRRVGKLKNFTSTAFLSAAMSTFRVIAVVSTVFVNIIGCTQNDPQPEHVDHVPALEPKDEPATSEDRDNAQQKRDDKITMAGRWKVVAAESSGAPFPDDVGTIVRFNGGEMIVRRKFDEEDAEVTTLSVT